jgi:hypothetical protein
MPTINLPLIGRRKNSKKKPRYSLSIKIIFPKIFGKKKSGAGGGSKG